MYLLGLGKSVFWVVDNHTYYFDSHGVQYRGHNTLPGLCEVFNALKTSCVLIDVDQPDWLQSTFSRSKFVLCTSTSREYRWQSFRKHFLPAERWFMKPWSTEEIAAAADKLGSAHEEVITRMKWCGPDPRHLFIGKPQADQQLMSNIISGLSGPNKFGVNDLLFLVRPAVVTDNNGERRLVRNDFVSEFLTPALAAMTVELAANHMNRLQTTLSWALDMSSTRNVAGRLIEGVMHRSLTSGRVTLPAVLGFGRVAATLELAGQAGVFTLKGVPTTERPLYLRPLAGFPMMDAMIAVSPRQLALLLTSLDDIDTTTFSTILPIIERLSMGACVDVEGLEDIVYCLVGTGGDAEHVEALVRKARSALIQLKKMDSATARIMSFRVIGVTFDPETGFTDVTRD
ncbi:hypothetical protein C8R47DRAFT_676855 [Mycena vitilis]|nr:hypothetical protein C8R47DRAFT_676855 [Mycena vitilis]